MVKNLHAKREPLVKKSTKNISSLLNPEEKTSDKKGLPPKVILPDGSQYTNQDIVSMKRLYRFGKDKENDKTWKKVEAYLIENDYYTRKDIIKKENNG